ncbi:tetratricopeptide repeat protein [Candidatus Ichthyocystis hellenicum]|uniref:tetratricopeptide repeat protein n=1 Tax=Candidatus Ichthyocystis hellenicum TaxID=1561003 RepID=UPI000B824AD5|nr:tetratricopeptide repeat protein [Candidatus Ichthyocystis hellenicum]
MYRWCILLTPFLLSSCLVGDGKNITSANGGYLPGVEPVNGPIYRAKIHVDLASAYYSRGKYGIALEEIDRALTTRPNYAPAYSLQGVVYAQLGEWTKARKSFVVAFKNDPNNPDIQNNYGWFLCQTEHSQDGIRFIKLALQNPLYETPDKAYSNMSYCYLSLHEYSASLKAASRAILLNRNSVESYFYRSRAEWYLADYASAQADINRVIHHYHLITPKTLQLAIDIQKKLGFEGNSEIYVNELISRFPDSAEAKSYIHRS